MVATIVKLVLELLIKFGLKKKQESDAQRVDASNKAIQSVGKSLEVEKEIRNAQATTKTDSVISPDGGCNFQNFNNSK